MYSPGLKWMPLLGLSIEYRHHYHRIDSNDDEFKGDSSTIALLYNPIHYDNLNVFIQLSQESHRGFGFNSIENALSQQQSGTFLRQSIRERHDEIFKASLQISVDILLPNYRYLDRLTISGEGYFKTIKDQVIERNNFDISGFYLKASILL